MLTWVAFLYMGIKARRPAWWGPGLGYLAVTSLAIAISSAQANADNGSTLGGFLTLAVWAGGTLHGFLVNRHWLRWLSEHQTPWYARPHQAGRPH
jgi:hypothetical protein